MHLCSRCGASTPTAASAEIRRRTDHQVHLLCAWCDQLLALVLAPVANAGDVDDLSVDVVHAASCRCDECDPDFHMELARDRVA